MKVTCFRAILIHFTTRNTIIVYSVLKFKDMITNRIAVGRVICMDPTLICLKNYTFVVDVSPSLLKMEQLYNMNRMLVRCCEASWMVVLTWMFTPPKPPDLFWATCPTLPAPCTKSVLISIWGTFLPRVIMGYTC
jgi:hypothetical protein